MKANKVLKLLNITRPTLCKYVKTGKLVVGKPCGGNYDYDDESVYQLKNRGNRRKMALYVGNSIQTADLERVVRQI